MISVTNINNYSFSQNSVKPRYKCNPKFTGHIGTDLYSKNELGLLIHETAFFRDLQTKNFVKRYIYDNLLSNKLIRIVVGGCSTGEEAITLSMLLDAIKDKVSILGIDLSEKAIKSAKSNKFILQTPNLPEEYLDDYAAFKDTFLGFGSDKALSKSQIKQKNLFDKFFEPVIPENSKTTIYQKISNYFKNLMVCISGLVKDAKEYKLRPNMAGNCEFQAGDINDINKITNGEKSHVIFFSNSLYHLVTANDDDYQRFMRFDSEKILNRLFSEFRKNLYEDGLVCFGEEEAIQIPKIEIVTKAIQDSGFVPMNETEYHIANVYRKVG